MWVDALTKEEARCTVDAVLDTLYRQMLFNERACLYALACRRCWGDGGFFVLEELTDTCPCARARPRPAISAAAAGRSAASRYSFLCSQASMQRAALLPSLSSRCHPERVLATNLLRARISSNCRVTSRRTAARWQARRTAGRPACSLPS